jgi:hypothetical protein
MAIVLLPFGKPERHRERLAELLIDDSMRLQGDLTGRKSLGDLSSSDHLILGASSRTLTASQSGLKCHVSLLLQEPVAIKPRSYTFCRLFGHRYHRILTHSSMLLSKLSNARFTVHGGAFVSTAGVLKPLKQHRISMVASSKNSTIGHRLRHRIAAWSKESATDLKLFGTAYLRVEDKREAHDKYFFSVCIENSRTSGYFTEKLIDSFLCRSLPIYWGAPDIAHFFDPRGMICCSSETELQNVIQNVTEADYQVRLPYLEENIHRAIGVSDFYANALNALKMEDDFNLNRAA